ncbi:anti-sigma factor family protein [Actinoplanes friuliensis]|jgi:anti-sigma factor RsiW|uniref:Putative transmembrane anti-sigma factor n=1 Tax=Actinoplanes friuliensis DSM 7358 TaxID=1246995 RepID=U5VP69_9ACTN|nr:zf-HC2 domain-containing protein [Actinoplanes friuliensis]AGZ38763.1 putative transmembrane anti-sigma factor [Actinoplanes friuliensis DSM 7358]
MNTNHVDLAGYLTKSLDAEQIRQVEEHLAGCAECRAEVESLQEWTMALEAVPEAMLLDGPPEGGDLLLQRTLRQIRDESSGRRHRRNALVGVAAAVVVAAAIASGAAVGRLSVDPAAPVALPTPVASEPTTIPGTKTATAVDAGTGARITVAVAPAPGWVRIKAAVVGIPAGERCRLEVIGKDGTTVLAGSWVVSDKGAAEGTTLDGSALVPPDQVSSVRVVTEAGKQYTSVDV